MFFTYRIYLKLIPIISAIVVISLVFSAFVLFPITLFMDLLDVSLCTAIMCDFVLGSLLSGFSVGLLAVLSAFGSVEAALRNPTFAAVWAGI